MKPSVNSPSASDDGDETIAMTRLRGAAAIVAAFLLATAMLAGVWASPAQAQGRDVVDSWNFTLEVTPAGELNVTETLVYRFGSSTGRHGIIRELVSREPYDDETDAVYDISNITVTSPDASPEFTRTSKGTGRNRLVALRIGSQDRTITTPTATYTISYTVRGAMRTFNGYDELYWDLISGEAPTVKKVRASVAVPGGTRGQHCSSAPPGQSVACTSAKAQGQRAVFTQDQRRTGDVLTIGVKVGSGLVSENAPRLEQRHREPAEASLWSKLRWPLATTGLSGVLAWVYARRKGRDLRFVGVPPGVIPASGSNATAKLSDPIEVPVAFSPPRISVAEAGLLADGQVDTRETTATIVDLAVRGALEISSGGEVADEWESSETLILVLRDRSVATAPHESLLLDELFEGAQVGEPVAFEGDGAMHAAHQAMTTSVVNQVSTRGWFTDVPRASTGIGAGVFVAGAFVYAFMAGGWGTWWPLLLAIGGPLIAWSWMRSRLARGQRTAVGRAITDQIEGFETYLTTAEADQLRFEEGEDIFSKYLPWAIIFEVADRWYEVCRPLMEAGRIPEPVFFHGHMSPYLLDSMLNDMAGPVPSSSGSGGGLSGTGFGGGSSFGGGGITSGGGGGGGSVSSW